MNTEHSLVIQALFLGGIAIGYNSFKMDSQLTYKYGIIVARFIACLLLSQMLELACSAIYTAVKTKKLPAPKLKARYKLPLYTLAGSVGFVLYNDQPLFLLEESVMLLMACVAVRYLDLKRHQATISYGEGMACSYAEGYLYQVIPSDGANFVGLEEQIRTREAAERIQYPVRKLLLVITKSLCCPPNLEHFNKNDSNLPKLELCNSLEDVIRHVAGVRDRVYRNTTYRLHRGARDPAPLGLVAECASPLHTLWKVLQKTAVYRRLAQADTEEISRNFCETLPQIVANSPVLRGKCELVYYDARFIACLLLSQMLELACSAIYTAVKTKKLPAPKLKARYKLPLYTLAGSVGFVLYNDQPLFLLEESVMLLMACVAVRYLDLKRHQATISYGEGMACSYAEGYLYQVIPSDGANFVGLEEQIRTREAAERIQYPVRKLLLVITKSLCCPPNLEHFNKNDSNLPKLELCNSLEDVIRHVAGVRDRVYRNTTYRLHRGARDPAPLGLVAECASPLHTLWKVLQKTAVYRRLAQADTEEISRNFCETLPQIVANSPVLRGKCELVYYDARFIACLLLSQMLELACSAIYTAVKTKKLPAPKLKARYKLPLYTLAGSVGFVLYNDQPLFLLEESVMLLMACVAVRYLDLKRHQATISYGEGMACSYAEGYLYQVIPSDGANFVGLEEQIRTREAAERIQYPVRKLLLVITKSLCCPPNLEHFNKNDSNLPKLELCNSLEDVIRHVAGVRDRVYRNTTYRLHRGARDPAPLGLVAECASPLHTLWKVLQKTAVYRRLAQADTEEISRNFCETLPQIVANSPVLRGKCELVYYDDTNPNENLAEVLLAKIRELEPNYETIGRE